VLGVDTEQYDPANPEKYLKALLRDEANPVAQRAFRSYLGVVPSPPVGFENFSERVNYYMEQPPFSFPNPLTYLGAYKTVSGRLRSFVCNSLFILGRSFSCLLPSITFWFLLSLFLFLFISFSFFCALFCSYITSLVSLLAFKVESELMRSPYCLSLRQWPLSR
jgi:hypothetical protein